MGKFNNLIVAEFHPPKSWTLTGGLVYTNKKISELPSEYLLGYEGEAVVVPLGFETDLASVPRIAWAFISPWDVARAAVIHDYLYKKIREYRATGLNLKAVYKPAKKAADEIFLMAMKDAEPSVWKTKIYSAYWSVRLFGRWAIKPRKEDK